MLEPKTKATLANDAFKMAQGFQLVRYHGTTYIPADFETHDVSITPDGDRTIWLPMSRPEIRLLAANQFNTLFTTDGELTSFDFMVAQNAEQVNEAASSLLVRTSDGLCVLDEQGQLVKPDGSFRPNALQPMLNTDIGDKAWIFSIISDWLDSEEEAESLLRHLATSLAPGWSAVKYVLLLGDGRNGKSVMLKMLHALFGRQNVSGVTRQQISVQSPVVTELNGKLLNIVYDGQSEYLKDSGTEKSLIAGETVSIRKLYESGNTPVQTNALFLEGLNREPKTHDKSSALQKRLSRFHFPNVYALNHEFEHSVLSEQSLGAFLALLVDRYVVEGRVALALAPTRQQIQLQLDQMYANQMGLQYLKYLEDTEPLGAEGLVGTAMQDLIVRFHSWRLKENDLGSYAEPDILVMFKPLFNMERKSVRTPAGPRKVQMIVSLRSETKAFIESLEGDDDAAHLDSLVED